jgi:hypothetical protein
MNMKNRNALKNKEKTKKRQNKAATNACVLLSVG